MLQKSVHVKAEAESWDYSFLQQTDVPVLQRVLKDNARDFPHFPAVIWRDQTLTYAELLRQVRELRAGMESRRINSESRVLVLFGNQPEYIAIFLALTATGAQIIPVDQRLPEEELGEIINETAPDFVFYPVEVRDRVRRPDYLFARSVLFVVSGGEARDQEITWQQLAMEPDSPLSDNWERTRVVYFYPNHQRQISGAEFSLAKLLVQAGKVRRRFSLTNRDPVFCHLSLGHFLSFSNLVLPAVLGAATVLLLERNEDDFRVLELIDRHNPTLFINTRKYFYILLKHLRDREIRGSIANTVVIADGTPMDWRGDFEEHFHTLVSNGFASPLLAGFVTMELPFLARGPAGSVGIPLIGITYRIVDEKGQDLETGEWGEILINSPFMLDRFFHKRDSQQEILTDGFVRTQQMGMQDPGGFLHLADEVRDVISYRGFRISPVEIEEVFNTMAGVEDSLAVRGFAAQGECIILFVKLQDGGEFPAEKLREEAEKRLVPYLRPAFIYLVDEIPYNIEDKKMRMEFKDRMENLVLGGTIESV